MPTGKQKNRKNREREPDGRFIRKEPLEPSLVGPSQAEPSPAFPTIPKPTLTARISPPKAP
jgi:hypothetical protein